jgi:hypothetical protein
MPGRADRLARLLDTSNLAQLVPRLAPEILHQLIQHRGLEACGALLAAATPGQVASVLDADVWHATPGRDDRFDERRFGMWIETLVEESEAVAARIVAAMDRRLATAGFSQYVRVFDPAVLAPAASSDDDERPDAPSSSHLESEIGGYVVRAKTSQAWDAIVALLTTLADEDPGCFHGLMQGCRRLSNSVPEADGLDDLMLAPEQLLHDVAAGRERRRSHQGYLTAADARAFLQMAKQPRAARPDSSSAKNRIVSAYFQTFHDAVEPARENPRSEKRAGESPTDPGVSESIAAVVDLLSDEGLASAPPRALLPPVADDVERVTPLQSLLEHLHDTGHVAYFARSRELAFLANALLAGCSVHSRPFTVEEARNAAAGICNLGLELWLERNPHAAPDLSGGARSGGGVRRRLEADARARQHVRGRSPHRHARSIAEQ